VVARKAAIGHGFMEREAATGHGFMEYWAQAKLLELRADKVLPVVWDLEVHSLFFCMCNLKHNPYPRSLSIVILDYAFPRLG
jgi:hypothetical protein